MITLVIAIVVVAAVYFLYFRKYFSGSGENPEDIEEPPKNELVFVTGNKNKLREVAEILGRDIDSAEIDLPEIQSIAVEDVVKRKVEDAYKFTNKPVIVEDTGLYIKQITCGGPTTLAVPYPGALIRSYMQGLGLDTICNIHNGSPVVAKTVVGYCDGKNTKFFVGEINGTISDSPKGNNGFGWDKIFIPNGHTKTFAEMESSEKNSLSMRKLAFEQFKELL
jgi:XTP/dITP diphosphohydrolase